MIEAKHKISFLERVLGFLGKGGTRYTIDWTPEKKYSDLTALIRKRYHNDTLGGRVSTDNEGSQGLEYEYTRRVGNAPSWTIHFLVSRVGDYATRVQVEYMGPGAAYNAKQFILDADKRLETVERPAQDEKAAPAEPTVPEVDYSAMDMGALVSEMSTAVREFGKAPSGATFAPIPKIKDAIEEKIDGMPAAKAAVFNKAMADMGLYVQAISVQLSTPMVNIATFAGTYVAQMKAAVSAMAAELEQN